MELYDRKENIWDGKHSLHLRRPEKTKVSFVVEAGTRHVTCTCRVPGRLILFKIVTTSEHDKIRHTCIALIIMALL